MAVIKKQNVSAQIIDYFLEKIETGAYKPGDRIPTERELTEILGVSRVPLREAICALTALGILSAHQGDGTFVNSFNEGTMGRILYIYTLLDSISVIDIMDVRNYLESAAAEDAAKKRTSEQLLEIKEKKEAFSAAYGKMTLGLLGVKEVMESDLEFHNAIARATGNRLFTEFLDAVRATVSKSYLKSRGEALTDPYRDPSLESALSAHERIVAAIEAQDPELAHRCMSEHVTQITSSLKQSEEEKL